MQYKYVVRDLSRKVFKTDLVVEARSPKEAVEKVLLRKVKRDYTGCYGKIIVFGKGRTHVYIAEGRDSE